MSKNTFYVLAVLGAVALWWHHSEKKKTDTKDGHMSPGIKK